MKAIRVQAPGGPEVLKLEEVETPRPGPGQVLIKVAAAGVNYADTGLRRGMAFGPHAATYPLTPGFEVAGTVAARGEGVTTPAEGARVAAVIDDGGYAEYAVAGPDRLWEIPAAIDFATATALLVQGLTAYGVLHDAARVQPGESVLVQAAAGGVGSLAVQLALLAGAAPVLGTAGGAHKCDLVRGLGAEPIDYTQEDWANKIRAATGGRGVDVVLDAVGGEAAAQAFGALALFGRLVTFGGASGGMLPLGDIMMPLAVRGLSLVGFGGPWVRPGRAAVAHEALDRYVEEGRLRVIIGASYPLAAAADAHRALEGRATTGKVVLTVEGTA